MSNYQRAIEIKARNDSMIRALECQVTTAQRDKTGLHWSTGKGSQFHPFAVWTTLHHGHYGSSSCGSDYREGIEGVIASVLNSLKGEIIERAIAKLKAETEEACAAAIEEAKSVLSTCESS